MCVCVADSLCCAPEAGTGCRSNKVLKFRVYSDVFPFKEMLSKGV